MNIMENRATHGADGAGEGARVLEAVRALVPELRAAQGEADHLARPPAHIVEKLREAGVYRLMIPRCYGGVGADMALWRDVVTELGRGSAAIAWAVTLGASATWAFTSFFPERVIRETIAGPDTTFAGVFSGRVLKSRPVEGGIQIDEGTWFFNSGSYEATHDLLGITLFDEAGAPVGPGLALVSMDDVERLDDWDPIGIRGSGSTNVRVRDLFVPAERIVPLFPMFDGGIAPTHDGPTAKVAFAPALISILTYPLLGAAQHMVEQFLKALPKRDIKLTVYTKAGEAPVTHLQIGEATAKIEAARLMIDHGVREMDAYAARGEVMPRLARSKISRDAAYAERMLWEAVDQIAAISGGSFSWRGNIGNAIWADVRVGTLHPLSSTLTNLENYGRLLCGMDDPIMPT